MDFSLTPEQEQFRRDVREFFGEERVQAAIDELRRLGPRREMFPGKIYRWLGERGWLAANWPEEYGGLGRSFVESAIVAEEMGRHGIIDVVRVTSIEIVGLFLLLAGTEEQRRRFLPPMARGEIFCAVLYTEPNAGSDLSGLESRALFEGDAYLLYGSKIYSQITQFAQYGLTLARTRGGSSRYDGLTLFLAPLEGPGVEVRPMWNLTDERFSEVVFDGLCVGPENIIGQEHEAWELINTALAIERTGLDYFVRSRYWLDRIIDRARDAGRLRDGAFADRIIALDAAVEAGRAMAWNMICQIDRGDIDPVAAAKSKWFNTETGRRVARLGLELDGLEGCLSRWDPESPLWGLMEAAYREAPGMTLSAGTSEMMLYTIAVAGLEINE